MWSFGIAILSVTVEGPFPGVGANFWWRARIHSRIGGHFCYKYSDAHQHEAGLFWFRYPFYGRRLRHTAPARGLRAHALGFRSLGLLYVAAAPNLNTISIELNEQRLRRNSAVRRLD